MEGATAGPTLGGMGNFRDLEVWQRSQDLAGRIDRETRRFTRGNAPLVDQLRRASLSVPTNIAEGASKGKDPDFLRFLGIAIGSAAEVESLLVHAASVGALDSPMVAELTANLTIIRKMLYRLRSALQRSAGAK